jgi:hypothetical protein
VMFIGLILQALTHLYGSSGLVKRSPKYPEAQRGRSERINVILFVIGEKYGIFAGIVAGHAGKEQTLLWTLDVLPEVGPKLSAA